MIQRSGAKYPLTSYNYEGGTMKLKTEQDLTCTDLEVTVKYAKKDKTFNRIMTYLQSVDVQIKCDSESTEHMVNASDIFYIESVDKQTFVYLEKAVYHTQLRLYQLIDQLKDCGFIQINKSCLLNINTLDYIRPLLNSKMEATLKNGEKVYINRNYLNRVKQALKSINEG